MNAMDLFYELVDLKKRLEGCFQSDTASPGADYTSGSVGHCAVVAIIVRSLYGGDFVSSQENREGVSHWFNRIGKYDIDLTGDQFGEMPVRIARTGRIWEYTRKRSASDLTEETIDRAMLLAKRAGLEIKI